ncbi:hypothetical protein [Paraburkholderia acidisoli]|uniref:Uncharacterized protein n=1 Tax=Paraburkholderia acidisoli TaxID=2571748 RepID=A0A7Z2JJB6_9BURK|nr:hypothetical protein [Paraburkholderia acidisoli]QGZ66053.1 hypothetical protein FAZ98_30010 [Paraburkholderia acidisoli]
MLAFGGCAHPSKVADTPPHKSDATNDGCRRGPDANADYASRCASATKREKAMNTTPMQPTVAASGRGGQPVPLAVPARGGTVYDSQVVAHFQPETNIKHGAAYESCMQMMDKLQTQYGRAPSCVADMQNGVDMSDVKHTVFVTFDGTDRFPITVETDVVSDRFYYRPEQINKLGLELQRGAGKSRAEWTRYYWQIQYRAVLAGLDYEQRVLDSGGVVIDDAGGGHRKLKTADLKMLRRRMEETNRKMGAELSASK